MRMPYLSPRAADEVALDSALRCSVLFVRVLVQLKAYVASGTRRTRQRIYGEATLAAPVAPPAKA